MVWTHNAVAREQHVFILEVLHGVLHPDRTIMDKKKILDSL